MTSWCYLGGKLRELGPQALWHELLAILIGTGILGWSVGLTTAGNFVIIYFSHEALGLGSPAGD